MGARLSRNDSEGRGYLVVPIVFVLFFTRLSILPTFLRLEIDRQFLLFVSSNKLLCSMMFAHDIVIHDLSVFILSGWSQTVFCLKQEIRHHCITI